MRLVLAAIGAMLLLIGAATAADWQLTQLDNGLKVMILENHQVPQVTISTSINVGAKNESDYFDGATHLLEHLILFRGTDNMTGNELAAAMKQHGAYFNGYTSSDWTEFVISLPSSFSEFAIKTHADMLFHSNFPTAEMDKERQAVIEEININEDNPTGKAYDASSQKLFVGHPYSKNVLGTKENVGVMARDSVYAYYKRYYAPNNMTTVMVGDIDAAKTLELVRKYFAAIPRGSTPQDRYLAPSPRAKVDSIEIRKDVDQAYLLMMSIGPRSESPDQFALDLVTIMLGDGESSRLQRRLKDELGLAYTTGFSFSTSKFEGTVFASATADPTKMEEAERAINQVLVQAKKEGFTERELGKAKTKVKTNFFASIERGLDMAETYARYDSYIGHQFLDTYTANIEKVTLADVNAAAQKYLNTDSYVRTMVVPK